MKINSSLITSEYNLITDGKPVKTGRKIDGKDEYVKRYHFSSLPNNSTAGLDLGFDLNQVTITEINGYAITNSNNYYSLSQGDLNNDTNASIGFSLIGSSNRIRITTYNSNFATSGKAYINIYFIYNQKNLNLN